MIVAPASQFEEVFEPDYRHALQEQDRSSSGIYKSTPASTSAVCRRGGGWCIQQQRERAKNKLNPSLEAGRRKLEEFKRKKAAVLSRRSSITSSQYNDSGVKSDVLEARLQEAQEEIKKMKSDVQRLTEEVEASREEKQGMEREKAALLGELVSIKASVEDSGSRVKR
eukprot:jgi/Picre1/32090/NNA_007438.t1